MIRSLLFVPGNSPSMLQNADIHRADALILDLEDAVAPDQKDAARILTRNAIRALGLTDIPLIIRINPIDTPICAADIAAMVPLSPAMLMPTKVGSVETVREVSRMAAEAERQHGLPIGGIGLIPLLETAAGIERAFDIAVADPRVRAIALGAEDLTSDLTAIRSKDGDEIHFSRSRVVIAARAAGIDCYDTPFTDVGDDEGMRLDAEKARALGFSGKAAISPRHVEVINRVFSPSEAEIAYAEEVLSTLDAAVKLGKGAVSLRGKMIDKPIVDRARRVLDAARQLGGIRT